MTPDQRSPAELFLKTLFSQKDEQEFIELRTIRDGRVTQKFYTTVEEVLQGIGSSQPVEEPGDIYLGVCPRYIKEGNKGAVRHVRCLWADLDFKGFAGGSVEALELVQKFPVQPSVVVHSGHGLHLYWLLKNPVEIKNLEDISLIESRLKGLASVLKADPTSAELARVLRLPGTQNHKNPDQVLPVKLELCEPDRRYDLAAFALFLDAPKKPKNSTKEPGWIAKALKELSDGNRHGTFVRIISRLHRDGWMPEDINTLLIPHAKRSEYLEKDLLKDVEDVCKRYQTSRNAHKGQTTQDDPPPYGPKDAIRDAATDKSQMAFDRLRDIASIARTTLQGIGDFYRTSDDRLFFFERAERRLYDLEQRAFHQLFMDVTGLSSTEQFFKFAMDMLMSEVARHNQVVEVGTLAVYEPGKNLLTVSNGTSGIWGLKNDRWTPGDNGQGGLIFLTDPEAEPWEPNFSANGAALSWFLDLFNFDGDPKAVSYQKKILKIWLVSLFFKPILRTKPIPAFLGGQGSGKSTGCRMIGRLYLGPHFDVTGIQVDKEDGFVAGITNDVFYAIDNADTRVKWLEDALARYATSEKYKLRRLYSTNELVSYKPRATLMLASRDPHFRRPDVAERLLPFNLKRFEQFQDEETLFAELHQKRPAIMGDLLQKAQKALEAIRAVAAPKLSFRMADFAGFGWRIHKHLGKEKTWEDTLGWLEKAQSEFVSEGESLIGIIREILDRGLSGPILTGELYKECRKIAERDNLPFSKNPQGFGKRFWENRRVIELELGVKISEEEVHAGKVSVSFQKS